MLIIGRIPTVPQNLLAQWQMPYMLVPTLKHVFVHHSCGIQKLKSPVVVMLLEFLLKRHGLATKEENFTVVPVQPVSAESKPSESPESSILRNTRVLLSSQQIRETIATVGFEVEQKYSTLKSHEALAVIGVLNGAAFFTCDLTREIRAISVEVGFMQLSSYGNAKKSSGQVKVDMLPNVDVKGRHVLVVEDVLDTGATVKKIREVFETLEPASLEIAVFADKGLATEKVDYVAFEVPASEFLIGYGMDSSGLLRNLTDVLVVE